MWSKHTHEISRLHRPNQPSIQFVLLFCEAAAWVEKPRPSCLQPPPLALAAFSGQLRDAISPSCQDMTWVYPRASSCEGIPKTPHPGDISIKWLNHLSWLLLLWRSSWPWSRKLVSSPIKAVLKKKVLSQSPENFKESCYPFLIDSRVSQTQDSTALNWSLFCSSAFVSSPYWHMKQLSTCCTFWLECASSSLRSIWTRCSIFRAVELENCTVWSAHWQEAQALNDYRRLTFQNRPTRIFWS